VSDPRGGGREAPLAHAGGAWHAVEGQGGGPVAEERELGEVRLGAALDAARVVPLLVVFGVWRFKKCRIRKEYRVRIGYISNTDEPTLPTPSYGSGEERLKLPRDSPVHSYMTGPQSSSHATTPHIPQCRIRPTLASFFMHISQTRICVF